jgi:hypothetical protein
MKKQFSMHVIAPVQCFDWYLHANWVPTAKRLGLYETLWTPNDVGLYTASEMLERLAPFYNDLRTNRYDLENIEELTIAVRNIVFACETWPKARIG